VFTGTVLLVLAGIWSQQCIPLDVLPDISEVQVVIHTDKYMQFPVSWADGHSHLSVRPCRPRRRSPGVSRFLEALQTVVSSFPPGIFPTYILLYYKNIALSIL
jgi:hypothetical protein